MMGAAAGTLHTAVRTEAGELFTFGAGGNVLHNGRLRRLGHVQGSCRMSTYTKVGRGAGGLGARGGGQRGNRGCRPREDWLKCTALYPLSVLSMSAHLILVFFLSHGNRRFSRNRGP